VSYYLQGLFYPRIWGNSTGHLKSGKEWWENVKNCPEGRRGKGSQHSILCEKKGNSTLIKKHSQHIQHELSIGIVGFQSKERVMGYVCFSMGKGAFWWGNGLFPL
jgi:hypothetical protein